MIGCNSGTREVYHIVSLKIFLHASLFFEISYCKHGASLYSLAACLTGFARARARTALSFGLFMWHALVVVVVCSCAYVAALAVGARLGP